MSERVAGPLDLRAADFERVLAGSDFLVVNFVARWCGPCLAFLVAYEEAIDGNDDIVFALVDVDREPELAVAFDVTAIPRIAVVRGGALVFSHEGALPEEALRDVLRQVRELDVDQLRRAVAEAGG